MARLRVIKVSCDEPNCYARAVRELHTVLGKRVGQFCLTHGTENLKELQKWEKKYPPKF